VKAFVTPTTLPTSVLVAMQLRVILLVHVSVPDSRLRDISAAKTTLAAPVQHAMRASVVMQHGACRVAQRFPSCVSGELRGCYNKACCCVCLGQHVPDTLHC
jgi:uncharacterized protein GlcG (DUF336 family)